MIYRIYQSSNIPKYRYYDIQRGRKVFWGVTLWKKLGYKFKTRAEAEKKLAELTGDYTDNYNTYTDEAI